MCIQGKAGTDDLAIDFRRNTDLKNGRQISAFFTFLQIADPLDGTVRVETAICLHFLFEADLLLLKLHIASLGGSFNLLDHAGTGTGTTAFQGEIFLIQLAVYSAAHTEAVKRFVINEFNAQDYTPDFNVMPIGNFGNAACSKAATPKPELRHITSAGVTATAFNLT